jgi:hypothetical protein
VGAPEAVYLWSTAQPFPVLETSISSDTGELAEVLKMSTQAGL